MSRSSFQRLPGLPWLFLNLACCLFGAGCGKEKPAAGASPAGLAAETAKAPPPVYTVFDLADHAVEPFEAADAKGIVFIFVSTDCPISNRYAPEMRRIAKEFARSGLRFWLVYPDADTSSEAIRKHLKEYQLPFDALRDPHHVLVRLGQVHVTPETAVFVPDRRLVYHGRIDNRYAGLGRERAKATQRDLSNVLQAILRGKPVPYASARAVGCYIADAK